MSHLVTLGFVLLLAALVVAVDGSLALRAIDQLAQSEGYTDIQNVMTVTNAPIRFCGTDWARECALRPARSWNSLVEKFCNPNREDTVSRNF
jgi:hypothetical protein